jgi:hypothetical protein
MEPNSLMSVSEAGVVLGIVLKGTKYVPSIRRRWPPLERIGFAILVLSLVADWHFQSAINERQTQALINAGNRIASLNRMTEELRRQNLRLESQLAWRALSEKQKNELTANMRPFAKQKIDVVSYLGDAEAQALGDQIAAVFKICWNRRYFI